MIKAFNLVFLANGQGTRFNDTIKKQFFVVDGLPLFAYSLSIFFKHQSLKNVIFVADFASLNDISPVIKTINHRNVPVHFVEGGNSRQESSFQGLSAIKNLSEPAIPILIHDAVRPLITSQDIDNLLMNLETNDGVSLGVPCTSSIAITNNQTEIIKIPDRNEYFHLITPQGFNFESIFKAHIKARADQVFNAPDDTFLLVRLKKRVKLIVATTPDLKVTTKHDLEIFKALRKEGNHHD
ncbi:MAG: 2-C-methyl-D-erythritol 4-phosphate cytidylyltransferase [Erysipelotrichaceae bacterium]|jgi:2-C-methyl-D-erythritol 4-phosphate cytidylyltransferase|nr:2-C-methyl-D-erythritol 4-phosphate cytidylyltransferase [Erysipelotrichaceae bacterium]